MGRITVFLVSFFFLNLTLPFKYDSNNNNKKIKNIIPNSKIK